MKSKKVTMLAAALVVAVVALAGVGYAAVSNYNATTTNTNNSLDSTYLTATQGGEGAYTVNFLTNMYFDSENTALNVTKYTPVYDTNVNLSAKTITTTDCNAAKISKDLSLTIVPTNSNAQNVDITVTTTNFSAVSTFDYILVLTKSSAPGTIVAGAVNTGNGWVIEDVPLDQSSGSAASTTYVVNLYINGSVTTSTGDNAVSMDEHAGFAASTAETANKTTFLFTIVADVVVTSD